MSLILIKPGKLATQMAEDQNVAPITKAKIVHNMYFKFLKKEIGKCEAVIKTIMTPIFPMDKFIENYLSLFADTDVNNFKAVLALMNLKRTEEQNLVNSFKNRNRKKNQNILELIFFILHQSPIS